MVGCNLMKCLLLIFPLLCICSSISNTWSESIGNPEVTIPQGRLRGGTWTTSHGRNVLAFWGIPYAQPPIGNLRFANPVPAGGWNGIRDASVGTISCPQTFRDKIFGQEDCLVIDVYTPQLPENANSSLLPVIVDIHGGAFNTESSAETQNPHFFLNQNVTLAVPNYRLGPLGFLSTGDEVASGNWGLKDQVLALKWVQSNIKYFGGDPDRVTLLGVSAGAVAVHLLTLIDETKGLFHQYITQSGSALTTWAHQPRAHYAKIAYQLGEYVGCSHNTSNSLIECLRAVDALDIAAAQSRFISWYTYVTVPWGPTDEPDIEGAVLKESPASLFAAGKVRDLPWITGVVRDEGLMCSSVFYVAEKLLREFIENFESILPIMLHLTHLPKSGAPIVNAVKSYYLGNHLTANLSELIPQLTLLFSDALFNYPTYNALRQQYAVAKNPQYFYNFHYRGALSFSFYFTNTTRNFGVTHADDAIYIFSRLATFAEYEINSMTEKDLEMADIMVQLWTSFATNGTPTSLALKNSMTWDPYSLEDNFLRIGNESDLGLDIQHSFHVERMQFWADLEAAGFFPNSRSVSASNALESSRIVLLAVLLLSLGLLSAARTLGS